MLDNIHRLYLRLPSVGAKNLAVRQMRHELSLYLMVLKYLFSSGTIRCHALSFAVYYADFHWSNRITSLLNRDRIPLFFPLDESIRTQKPHFVPAAWYASDTNTYPIA